MIFHCARPTRAFRGRALREHRRSSGSIPLSPTQLFSLSMAYSSRHQWRRGQDHSALLHRMTVLRFAPPSMNSFEHNRRCTHTVAVKEPVRHCLRDEAKEMRPGARPQARKNRRRIHWNTLRIFSGRERRRWAQIIRRSRTVMSDRLLGLD